MRALIIAVLPLSVLLSLRSSGQEAPTSLDLLTRSVTIGDKPLPAISAFEGTLQLSGVPGGVAFLEGCPDQPLPKVHPHGTTLRDALDGITAGDPSYAWRIRNGVVNLEPSRGLPALLRIHLTTYDSRDLTDAISAVTFLSSSPEVTRAATRLELAQNVLNPGLGGVAPGPAPPKKLLAIRLHNVTLLDALNAIARVNKHGVWTYRETHCRSIHQFNLSFAK
jgi:hypothetical protein